MTPQQYQQELLLAANEVSEAREKLASAQAKLMALIGHAHVFGVPQTVTPEPTVLGASQEYIERTTQALTAAAAPPTMLRISDLPAAGTTPVVDQPTRITPIDFNDPSFAGVPRSTISTPATPAPEGPTEEPAPIAQRVEAFEEQRKQEQLGHFLGTGSLFARYLSPEVIQSGKGFLKPGVAGLKQYNEDATQLSTAKLLKWPTGFYRNAETKEQQFLLVCDRGAVVLPYLPGMAELRFAPLIALRDGERVSEELQTPQQIELLDLLSLKESVERTLRALFDKSEL